MGDTNENYDERVKQKKVQKNVSNPKVQNIIKLFEEKTNETASPTTSRKHEIITRSRSAEIAKEAQPPQKEQPSSLTLSTSYDKKVKQEKNEKIDNNLKEYVEEESNKIAAPTTSRENEIAEEGQLSQDGQPNSSKLPSPNSHDEVKQDKIQKIDNNPKEYVEEESNKTATPTTSKENEINVKTVEEHQLQQNVQPNSPKLPLSPSIAEEGQLSQNEQPNTSKLPSLNSYDEKFKQETIKKIDNSSKENVEGESNKTATPTTNRENERNAKHDKRVKQKKNNDKNNANKRFEEKCNKTMTPTTSGEHERNSQSKSAKIAREPSCPGLSSPTYVVRQGTTEKGRDYESITVANITLNLIKNKNVENFQIASNDGNYGAFDDVVFEKKSIDGQIDKYLIQLKHVNKKKNLAKDALIKDNGSFSIKKYFTSFVKINDPTYHFILFTNLKFDGFQSHFEWGSLKLKTMECTADPLINTNSHSDQCFKFCIVEDSDEISNQSEEKEKYKTFFQKFFLYTNQANAIHTRGNVSENFREMFTCNNNFDSYMQFIEGWSKQDGEREKLNETWVKCSIAIRLTSQFVQPLKLFPSTVSEKSKLLMEAISQFNVTIFQKQQLQQLQQMWGDYKSKLKDIKKINKIILRYGLNVPYVNDISQLTDLECSTLLWLMDEVPLIVLETPATLKAIELCPNKKFILLRETVGSTGLQNVSTFERLSDLKQETKFYEEIVNKFQCSLQGKEVVNLKFLIEQNEELPSLITTTELSEMLNEPLVIGENKEELPDPHIDRKLTSCTIDQKFLTQVNNEDQKTLIVISCRKNLNAIKKYIRDFNLIDVKEYLKDATKKHPKEKSIYINEDECSQKEFDEICQRNSKVMKQCHHFRITDGKLEWVKSKGNIDDLEPFRLENYLVKESELYDSQPGNDINIICANPGMGKSTMIKNLKNKLSSKFWTIIVHPTDVSAYFREENIDFEAFMESKLKKKYTDFDINVMKCFIAKNRIAYIWDGMDEISDSNLKSAMDIIDKLSKKGYLQWITSRCHLKEKLENKFKVCSRTITQFDKIQQETYIQERLKDKCQDEIKIKDIIKKIKKNIEIIKSHEVLGIPLQIYMLTELFREDTEKYTELLDHIFSLTDLYQHFVHEKFNRKYKERANVNAPNDFLQNILDAYKDSYIKKYEKSALKGFLEPEDVEKLNISSCDTFLTKIKAECDAFGLITEVSDNLMPTFLHNSYGEFFVASYFFKNYNKITDLKKIIFRERYTNVRFLFDLLMAKNCPTHLAVLYQNLELLKKYETELKCKDTGGRNPLQVACTWGQTYPLLNTITSEDEEGTYLINDKQGALVEREDSQYAEIIEYLLQHCDCKEKDTLFEFNSILYADSALCLFPFIEISKTVKIDFAALTNFKDTCSLLYYAVKFDYAHIIDVGEDIPFVRTQKRGLSLLHLCAEYNSQNCLKRLLSTDKYRQMVNSCDQYDVRPISIACKKGHRGIVQMLIDADADLSSVAQLLENACKNGHNEVIELLINSANLNIENDNRNISSLMHTACLNGHDKIVTYLLNFGVKADTSSRNGSSIYVASQYGHDKTVEILIGAGADINKANKFGSTPLHIACQRGNIDTARILINAPNIKINAVDKKGLTALHSVCKNGNREIVQLLLESKANVNLLSKKKSTALHNACQFGFEEIVAMLIRAEADINCVCSNGFTALRYACENEKGHPKVVQLLVEVNADVNIADNKGAVPLEIAREKGLIEIVEILSSCGERAAAQTETDV